MECFKKFRGILFGYEINVFSYHKNLVYAATLSESQRLMCWKLILEDFGLNIQHIAGVDNIVADIIGRFPSTSVDKYKHITSKARCCANNLFATGREENNKDFTAKSLRCAKITPKVAKKSIFQTQCIHFGSEIWLIQSIS